MVRKGIGLLVVLLVFSISVTTAFALTELERVSITDPKLVNAFGIPLGNSIIVDQQIQISAEITNNQVKSQNFYYLIQIKDKSDFVVSFGWISGQLTPDQKFSPSLSWTPNRSGEFTAEIFVWERFPINPSALSEFITMQINVS